MATVDSSRSHEVHRAMEIQYDPLLTEAVVLQEISRRQDAGDPGLFREYHIAADPLYHRRPDARDAAFEKLHEQFFIRLGFAERVEAELSEFPSIEGKASELLVALAASSAEEGADLSLEQASDNDHSIKRIGVRLRADRFLDPLPCTATCGTNCSTSLTSSIRASGMRGKSAWPLPRPQKRISSGTGTGSSGVCPSMRDWSAQVESPWPTGTRTAGSSTRSTGSSRRRSGRRSSSGSGGPSPSPIPYSSRWRRAARRYCASPVIRARQDQRPRAPFHCLGHHAPFVVFPATTSSKTTMPWALS